MPRSRFLGYVSVTFIEGGHKEGSVALFIWRTTSICCIFIVRKRVWFVKHISLWTCFVPSSCFSTFGKRETSNILFRSYYLEILWDQKETKYLCEMRNYFWPSLLPFLWNLAPLPQSIEMPYTCSSVPSLCGHLPHEVFKLLGRKLLFPFLSSPRARAKLILVFYLL